MSSRVLIRRARPQGAEAAVAEVMERLQWRDHVPGGASVVVKPNLCTKRPECARAANTAPEVLEAVCAVLRERTTDITIVESDGMRHTAEEVFELGGVFDIARRLGIRCLNLSRDEGVAVDHPLLRGWPMSRTYLAAGVFVTVPTLKTHVISTFSGALKNQWGCIPRRDRLLLHKHLHRLLADVNLIKRPHLSIMDGLVCMEGMGPALGDPVQMDLVLGSTDPVALDATAMRLIGLDPRASRHVARAADLGLGSVDEPSIEVDGPFAESARPFRRARRDLPIRLYELLGRSSFLTHNLFLSEGRFEPVRRAGIWFRRITARG